jgi:hypothetical protein
MKYDKAYIDKHSSESSNIQNAIKQGDALLPLVFNF